MEQEGLSAVYAHAYGSGAPSPGSGSGSGDGSGGGDAGGRGRQSTAADSGARLVFVTHPAYERDVQACLGELRHLDVVHQIGGLLRVIGP
jgi:hypothetical protein